MHLSKECYRLFISESENEKSLFIWPSQMVFLLLEKYEEREEEFKSGKKRHQKNIGVNCCRHAKSESKVHYDWPTVPI